MHPEDANDFDRFAHLIDTLPLNDLARTEANKVLNRLARENGGNEYALLYDYLEYLLSLPWQKEEANAIDVAAAESILDEDHYGLKKVKTRVIEQIAVMALRKNRVVRSCFCGASWHGQNVCGPEHCAGFGAQVCAREPGRCAR
mgnify:CR=1 FL=1